MKKNSYGQSMFEILLSILFISLTFVAIVNLVIASVRNSTSSKDKSSAGSSALEAEEWLRSEKEKNWTLFGGKAGSPVGKTYCFNVLSWPSAGVCTDTMTGGFVREAYLTLSSPEKVNSKVKVYWTDPKGYHEVTRTTEYSNVSY